MGDRMIFIILIVVLAFVMIAVLPQWSHMQEFSYGPYPSIGIAVVVLVLAILLIAGVI
jgi:hypothetical protein